MNKFVSPEIRQRLIRESADATLEIPVPPPFKRQLMEVEIVLPDIDLETMLKMGTWNVLAAIGAANNTARKDSELASFVSESEALNVTIDVNE